MRSVAPPLELDASYAREVPELVQPWRAATAPEPRLLVANPALAAELGLDLGLDADDLERTAGVELLVGNWVPEGTEPVALAYAGHQFGNYSPRLGDGRALLLGELVDPAGHRHDLHLKGSGRTPFARGGDGFATVGPMLREYLVSEAMHALGVPTTRALAVTATGADVRRETRLPGAVLARTAASHLRVGTFEYAARLGDPTVVRRLADHAIARHHPGAADADNPYLALLTAVVEAQAALVARWMLVGFVHGVMNTDNMTISGETIDYGPCAFLDAHDTATVFSSIDDAGRYAYGRQPAAAVWNLTRLGETLLPLIDEDLPAAVEAATAVLESFGPRYDRHRTAGLRRKLGLAPAPAESDTPAESGRDDDPHAELLRETGALLDEHHVDHTAFFRGLSAAVRGDDAACRDLFVDRAAFDAWAARWRVALPAGDPAAVADAMDRVNPRYIPRNDRVEEALDAAVTGDMAPFERLLDAVTHPFDEHPDREAFAGPGPGGVYVTYCGT